MCIRDSDSVASGHRRRAQRQRRHTLSRHDDSAPQHQRRQSLCRRLRCCALRTGHTRAVFGGLYFLCAEMTSSGGEFAGILEGRRSSADPKLDSEDSAVSTGSASTCFAAAGTKMRRAPRAEVGSWGLSFANKTRGKPHLVGGGGLRLAPRARLARRAYFVAIATRTCSVPPGPCAISLCGSLGAA